MAHYAFFTRDTRTSDQDIINCDAVVEAVHGKANWLMDRVGMEENLRRERFEVRPGVEFDPKNMGHWKKLHLMLKSGGYFWMTEITAEQAVEFINKK